MSITATITKTLEPGFVQVDAAEKNGYKRYYKVPKRNAGIFAQNLEKQNKNLNLLSNITFILAVIAGVFGAARFTKNIESRLKQFLIQTASGVGVGILSTYGFNMYAQSEEQNLLKENGAKEIFYRA